MENKDYGEIMDLVLTRLTENGIAEQRQTDPSLDKRIRDKTDLSVKVTKILSSLDDNSRETLTRYYEENELIADSQVKYLYLQGAKDCVVLLKQLGVI